MARAKNPRRRQTSKQEFQQVVAEYRAAGNEWPARSWVIAGWALDNGKAIYSRLSQRQMLARSISRAMGEEVFTDNQGRRARRKHCFPRVVETPSGMKTQQFLWCDIETATPEEFRSAVTYRRRQMVGDAKQLKIDVDSFNENNKYGAQLLLNLDLTKDVIEGETDTEYNPPPPPED